MLKNTLNILIKKIPQAKSIFQIIIIRGISIFSICRSKIVIATILVCSPCTISIFLGHTIIHSKSQNIYATIKFNTCFIRQKITVKYLTLQNHINIRVILPLLARQLFDTKFCAKGICTHHRLLVIHTRAYYTAQTSC